MIQRMAMVAMVAAGVLAASDRATGPISAEIAKPLLKSTEPAEICLRPDMYPAYASADLGQAADRRGPLAVPADWPVKDAVGGDIPPTRVVADPYPTFDGLAVDPENDLVVMSDENRSGLFIYDRKSGSQSRASTQAGCLPAMGPRTPRPSSDALTSRW